MWNFFSIHKFKYLVKQLTTELIKCKLLRKENEYSLVSGYIEKFYIIFKV